MAEGFIVGINPCDRCLAYIVILRQQSMDDDVIVQVCTRDKEIITVIRICDCIDTDSFGLKGQIDGDVGYLS